ncbi:MAG: AI-2E family transporter [Myxococcota bacterium]
MSCADEPDELSEGSAARRQPIPTSPSGGPVGPRLWNIRAVQDAVLLASAVGAVVLLIRIQAAVIPIVIAFVLAYILDPVISWTERHWEWRRLWVVLGLIFVLILFMTGFFIFLAPRLGNEVARLIGRLPAYFEILRQQYGLELPQVEGLVTQISEAGPKDVADILTQVFGQAGKLVQTLTQILGTTLSLGTASLLTLIVFGFFAVRFPKLPSIKQFLPQSRRDEIWGRFKQVESVFAGFFRGQLLVAVFTTTIFSIGFSLAGVPYWFVASIVGGTFSIVPYGQGLGWLVAISLNFFESQAQNTDVSLTGIFLGPSIVYAVMQSLETFVVTPLVQGSSTRLHPVAVLVSVVAGGSLGGILGVFLAIPIAASIRILLLEILIPRLRLWAETH